MEGNRDDAALRAEREARRPPSPLPRRRGRPSTAELAARLTPEVVAEAKARIAEMRENLTLIRRSGPPKGSATF
jgi:hypothetical protein